MADLRPVQPPPAEEPTVSSGSWLHWVLQTRPSLPQSLPALHSPGFRLFWIGQMVSLTGTWVQSVAQQWLVLKLTGSAFSLGLVTAAQFTPLLLLGLVGGAISDRLPKRNLIMVTQIISVMIAVVLGILVESNRVQYWHVLVAAGTLGIVNAFYTPARQAFVPELVDKEALMNAVALNSAVFNASRVIGPAVGGVLVASLGLYLNFYLNAASFIPVIIALFFIHPQRVVRADTGKRLWHDVVEGIRYIRGAPSVYTILVLVGVSSLFGLNFTTLMPLFARYVLDVGSVGYGILMAAMGVGSLVGAIVLAFINRRDMVRRFIFAGAFTLFVTEILFGFSRIYMLSIALLVIIGLSQSFFSTTANTRVLSTTPNNLQGRVMSVYSLMFLGMTPFGSLLSGLVAEHFGAPAALIAGAAITLAFTLFIFIYRPERRGSAAPAPG